MGNKFSKSTIVIRFNLLPVCLSIPPFAFVLLFISSFYVLSSYFCFTEFGGGFYSSNFEKFRDAAPLRAERTLVIPPSLILLVAIVLF